MLKAITRGRQTLYVEMTPEEVTARLAEIEQAQPTPEQLAQEAAIADAPISARAWFAANPNAKLIWSMTVPELVTEISNLVDNIVPLASAANRTKLKLLLTGVTLAVRIFVKRERLD